MAEPLVPGTVAEHTGCLLLKLGQVVYRLAERALEADGLRVRHYSVLQALADNGAMSQHALGAYLRIDPATMVATLADLEQGGRTTRVRDAADRRRYVVDLTDSGREALRGADAALVGVDDTAFADLSPTSVARCTRSC
ncbi:MarR family winged helix-turn-helix transcriptional regulator [Actinokineospora soli]|uniref:MarR family winged helix-turn-helix transcriptional regulator n=1 Tax=Actinokineospora soli TaxID=1048753 RepID=A0ABW2TQK0_9PSEU